METENAGIELQKIAQQKQVSWHDDVKDAEPKDPTPIGSVPKPPSLNTQSAQRDRSELDRPKTVSMKKGPREEQVLDKCCPSCWTDDSYVLGGLKNTCLCYIASGPVEEFIRILCCDCFFDCYLKEKSDIKEGNQEDSDSE